MSRREKRLLIFLSTLGGLALVVGTYALVYSPWQEAREQARTLNASLDDKQYTLSTLEGRTAKLKSLAKRSLPGDKDAAHKNYSLMLYDLMRAAGVPKTSGSTVDVKGDPGDAGKVPTLGTKQPAYTRICYSIVLRKVDLPTVVRFLELYYRQPVLQQITMFGLKKGTDNESKGRESRADLEATIVTEGVIIEGTPKNAAMPAPAANLPPLLARTTEQYALLKAKDVFHGPLPELPRTPPKDKPKDEVIETKPLEDISPFIRLTGITWRNDGTATADIRDNANNFDYEVSRKFTLSGDLAISVKKYWYLKNERKILEANDDLIIQEDGTATSRRFKVLDITAEGLVLRETVIAKVEAATDEESTSADAPEDKSKSSTKASKPSGKGSYQGKTMGSKTPVKKPATASAFPPSLGAVLGGFAYQAGKPTETLWLWPVGMPLSKLQPLGAVAKTREATPMPRAAEDK